MAMIWSLAVATVLGLSIAGPGPATAESTGTSCAGQPGKAFGSTGWPSQCWMVNDSNFPNDRDTWVLDPGVGNFLNRDQLLAHAAQYQALGFSQQFLWYAPMTQVHPDPGSLWSACPLESRPLGTFCSNVNTLPQKTIGHDLTVDDTLDAISYGDNWIALACGNFHLPVDAGQRSPAPVIRGFKFNDINRNGVQDAGEAGLAGITFTLSRIGSAVGQPAETDLASTTSDAAGNFSFTLDGDNGPGTYLVAEQFSSDWPNTTPLSLSIAVPEGAGDGENLPQLRFGDRQEIPPVAIATPQEADQDSPQGALVTLDGSGSYSPTGDPLSYQWTWPSGTASGTTPQVVLPPGVTQVSLTVSDGVKATTTSTTVTVYPPISALPVAVSSVEGLPFTAPVATFTDPDPAGLATDYLASIDWGDGTQPSAGSISKSADGTFTVTAMHTYAEEGNYPASVTITDDDVPYNTASVDVAATVTDASLQATGTDFLSTNPVHQTLATFTDTNPTGPLSDFSASIDWGDGSTSTGTVSGLTGGPFSVDGSHQYSALGYKTITVHIVDIGGSTATAVDHLLLYATSGFVIGDLNSAIGTHVTYWGAQWWKLNDLSGGSAPAAFKGYQDSTGGDTAATSWTTRPGNSSGPPATVPAFISVIVAGQVSQNGSTISGDAPQVVIVQTDPGYAANPGHAGSGTVVARLR